MAMRSAILPERFWPVLLAVVIAYAVIALAACLFQDRLLYFPNVTTRSGLSGRLGDLGLALWPEGTPDYHGLVSVRPPETPKGTVLVFHGNAGSAADRSYYVLALQRLGYRVVLFEYPGYGARRGKLGEEPFVAAAERAARAAVEAFGDPFYVWGESLGCGMASAIAGGGETAVAGAVMLTPWDTLPDLAQNLYWYLPAKWLARDRYDNIENLGAFNGPVAVIMAADDEIVPTKRTMRFFDSLSCEKKLWVFDNAGHNSWPTAPTLVWWKEVMDFVSGQVAGDSPP